MFRRFLEMLLDWLPPGMFIPDDRLDARSFVRRMHREALPFIEARTVVLYGKCNNGLPYILGTGVPLRCGPTHFVATASHLFDGISQQILEQKAAVYLRPGADGAQLMALNPLRMIRSAMPESGDRRADVIDACLIELPAAIVNFPHAAITYVELNEVDPFDEGLRGSYYFLNGFPSENLRINRCTNTLRCKSLPYGTITYDESRGPYPQYEDIHLDLDFHPRRAADDTGRRTRLPDPRGISGCGIWRLSRAGAGTANWTANDVKLVAIEHRYNAELHVLRGTNIKYLNRIIYDRFPHLRQHMHAAWH